MKKSRKLLCVLLALVMVVSLLPVMAFAADEDVAAEETTAATVEETSPETEGVVSDVIKNLFAKLPNYLVAVKTSDGRVAAGAQVVIYNQNKDQVATAVANYGVAIFSKKDHLNTYSVSATWTDPNTNIKYQSLVGFNWSFGKKPDIDVITVYPTIDMILNTTDHNAYIKGYPDGTVRPDGRITRAEVATIFFRLLTEKTRKDNLTKYHSFRDVPQGAWYNAAVATMAKLKIITGYPDGTFQPDAPVTRAEFAAIAARFDEKSARTTASFRDIYGHWAERYISRSAELGWIRGYTDNTFRPDQSITRAEAMALINRVLNRNPESKDDLLRSMNIFNDNLDTAKWYYLDVQEAANSHDFIRKANGYEMWKKLRADPDWKALER